MTHASFASAPMPSTPLVGDAGYRPGVCNIGPAEIARRRRAGHVGLGATVVLLAVLLGLHTPPLVRLLRGPPGGGRRVGLPPGPPALLCRLRVTRGVQLRPPRRRRSRSRTTRRRCATAHERRRSAWPASPSGSSSGPWPCCFRCDDARPRPRDRHRPRRRAAERGGCRSPRAQHRGARRRQRRGGARCGP